MFPFVFASLYILCKGCKGFSGFASSEKLNLNVDSFFLNSSLLNAVPSSIDLLNSFSALSFLSFLVALDILLFKLLVLTIFFNKSKFVVVNPSILTFNNLQISMAEAASSNPQLRSMGLRGMMGLFTVMGGASYGVKTLYNSFTGFDDEAMALYKKYFRDLKE